MLTLCDVIDQLKIGKVLILPTDTLYGLGANAYNFKAVKNVFDLKKRAYSKALPVHYSSIEMVLKDCVMNEYAINLAEKFWPGGLTIVLKKREKSLLQFVQDTVAVRIPKHQKLLDIIDCCNFPLVMPSANISDCENIFKFDELFNLFKIDGVKDDDNLAKNPSTIIKCIDDKVEILRNGVVII